MHQAAPSDDRWPRGRARDGGIDQIPLPCATGSLWLAGKHAVGPDPELALGRAGDARVLVCLTERHELVDRYPDYVDWLGAHGGVRALWWPVPDLHAPGLDEAARMVGVLAEHVRGGAGLLVHCGAGIGRAGTVATCLLIELGMGLGDALEAVATNRPMAGPEVGSQRDLVHAFAASRRRSRC